MTKIVQSKLKVLCIHDSLWELNYDHNLVQSGISSKYAMI